MNKRQTKRKEQRIPACVFKRVTSLRGNVTDSRGNMLTSVGGGTDVMTAEKKRERQRLNNEGFRDFVTSGKTKTNPVLTF